MTPLERNWAFINSWTSSNNELHGVVSTYWDEAIDVHSPHVMNHFPVVEGLSILQRKFPDAEFVNQIHRYSEFLVNSFNEKNKLFENAWGDLPGKPTGIVHQAAASGALLEACLSTKDENYYRVARDNLRACKSNWQNFFLNGVLNQTLKYVQAICKLKDIDETEYKRYLPDLRFYLDVVEKFQVSMPKGGVLLDQSIYNCLLMTVYESKCLHGLLALYENGIEKDRCRVLIENIIKGINANLYLDDAYVSHLDIREGLQKKAITKMFAISRRLLPQVMLMKNELLRRRFLRSTLPYDVQIGPVWASRMADTAYIFRRCASVIEEDISNDIKKVESCLSDCMQSHGGVSNAVDLWKFDSKSWAAGVCSTRWNAYVFRYYADCEQEKPSFERSENLSASWEKHDWVYEEDGDRLVVRNEQENKHYVWVKPD